jgi:hypothetical protein
MNQRNVGHVRWRRGLLEHYAEGRLNLLDATVFNILLAQADFRTGSWRGNIWTVDAVLPRDVSRKNINEKLQDSFARLEERGYIAKQFKQGQREYVLWIDKYEPGEDKRVNALASAACGKAVYYQPGEEPGDAPAELPGALPDEAPSEDRVDRAQVAHNKSVTDSNNSIIQELNNSSKIERKSEFQYHVDKDGSEQEPHKVLCLALAEAMGSPASLNVIQRKLEEKARALLSSATGFTVDDLLPILRAALAGELDDKHWQWSSLIRRANNPMAMFAAKVDLLIARYGALERSKAAEATRSSSPQDPGVVRALMWFDKNKK